VDAPLRTLSLFSGGGGLDLGVELAVGDCAPVAFVEREAFACAVLLSRMEEGRLAAAPVWSDVATFDGRRFRGLVDIVIGGSPCQDLSVAGKRAGLGGARSGLFFHFVRIVEECSPSLVFWENVGGAESSLPVVFDSFEALGYRGAAVALRASDVGASHERRRLFLLAYRDGGESWFKSWRPRWARWAAETVARDGSQTLADAQRAEWGAQSDGGRGGGERGNIQRQAAGGARDVRAVLANHHRQRRVERGGRIQDKGGHPLIVDDRSALGDASVERPQRAASKRVLHKVTPWRRPDFPPGPRDLDAWRAILERRPELSPAQPRVRRVADGLAGGLESAVWADRLRLLGNGVVPAQAAEAFRYLAERLAHDD
jgi:DNA (cytosine-5)-methyltransferase 1